MYYIIWISDLYYPFGGVWKYPTRILAQNSIPHLIRYQSYVLSLLYLIPYWFQYQYNQRPPLSLILLVFLFQTFFCGNLYVILESDASSYFLATKSSSFSPWLYIMSFFFSFFGMRMYMIVSNCSVGPVRLTGLVKWNYYSYFSRQLVLWPFLDSYLLNSIYNG